MLATKNWGRLQDDSLWDIAQCDIDPSTSGLNLLMEIDESFAGHKPFKVIELVECVRSPVAAYFKLAIEQLEAGGD